MKKKRPKPSKLSKEEMMTDTSTCLFRLPSQVYIEFKAYCVVNHVPMKIRLRQLIEEELRRDGIIQEKMKKHGVDDKSGSGE